MRLLYFLCFGCLSVSLSDPACPVRCSCVSPFVFPCPCTCCKVFVFRLVFISAGCFPFYFEGLLSFISCISFVPSLPPLIPWLLSAFSFLLFPISNQMFVFNYSCLLCGLCWIVCCLFLLCRLWVCLYLVRFKDIFLFIYLVVLSHELSGELQYSLLFVSYAVSWVL